ncbi:MAG: hypothetical protein WBJ93_03420, partial [Candidatus Methanoculleus thermohydrogenotrophicum]
AGISLQKDLQKATEGDHARWLKHTSTDAGWVYREVKLAHMGANPTDRKAKCFYVPVEEIRENNYDLSISRYKEIEYEEVEYDPPEVIIGKIEDLEREILENLSELKVLLGRGQELCAPCYHRSKP